MKFNIKDNRFVNWDSDFSLTYWTLKNPTGDMMGPVLQGLASVTTLDNAKGKIAVSGASGTKYLNVPVGSDFTNRWTHIGIVYKESVRTLTYYLDGESIGSVSVPSGDLALPPAVLLASSGSNGTALDEVRFWSKALSSSEMFNELFIPVDVSSSDILAAFSFDSSSDAYQESDNGSGWDYEFEDVVSSSKPQVRVVPAMLIDDTVKPSGTTTLEAKVPFGQFGSNKVSLQSVIGSFAQEKKIVIQASSCLYGCAGEDLPSGLKTKRFSPYIYVSAIADTSYYLVLQIPIDVQAMSSDELSNLAVIQISQFGLVEFLEPFEKNVFGGYVKVRVSSGGVFWAGNSSTYQTSAPTFTNADLYKNGYQRRTYFAQIDGSQSSYTVTASTPTGIDIAYSGCSGSAYPSSPDFFPITFTNLATGWNTCFAQVPLSLGYDIYGREIYTFPSYTFSIQRGNL